MQIVAGALVLGVVVFLAVAVVIGSNRPAGAGRAPAGDLPIISLVAAVLLAVQAPLAFLLPGLVTRNGLRQIASGSGRSFPDPGAAEGNTDVARLLGLWQTTLIIGLALLEGTAFLGCIAFLVEAQPFAVAVVLVSLLLMAVKFPTEGRVLAWLEQQAGRLAELRQEGGAAAGP
jgi:hypothetical protein